MRSSFNRRLPSHSPSTRNSAPPGSEGDQRHGPGRRELRLELLQSTESLDLHFDRGVEIALGVDGHV